MSQHPPSCAPQNRSEPESTNSPNSEEEQSRKKTLLITRNFPPLWGGMERLNWHMAGELAKAFAVQVIGPTGASLQAAQGASIEEAPLKPVWRFLSAAALRACRLAHQWRPDIVLAGSGLTAPLAWLAAQGSGIRTAVYVHGLDLAMPHPLYQTLWHPLLRRMDLVIANSRATAKLAQDIGIAPDRITIIHPGVEIPSPAPTARARFREKYDIPAEAPLLLSVGRLTERKGLREFVSEVLPIIATERPNVVLAIVGDTPSGALYAQAQTPDSILRAAREAGVEHNLRLLGKQFGQDLADAYFAADLHVFPVRHLPSDPEGFGMVAVEAAAHGLATVAYATGGVIDAVHENRSGKLAPPGDAEAFAQAALSLLTNPIPSARCRAFAEEFDWSLFGHKLIEVLSRHD